MPRLVDQIREALVVFASCAAEPALIGGLALAAHNVVRATQDVDFLADSADADRLHEALLKLGYLCVHRSEDAANYLRGDEGLDLLYAHRPVAWRLLEAAQTRETPMGRLRALGAEGLIGFKLQGYVNDSTRARDIEDSGPCCAPIARRSTCRKCEATSACLNGRRCWMKSLLKSIAESPSGVQGAPFAASGGTAYVRPSGREPLVAWMELMEVVEILCPRWPTRPLSSGSHYLL